MLCKVKLERVLSAAKVFFQQRCVEVKPSEYKATWIGFKGEKAETKSIIFNMDKIREKLDSPARCFQ